MAQKNSGGRTAAVKDEENKGSRVMPWVVGGLVGVAAGLLGSVLVDKAVKHVEAQETAQAHG